MDRKHPVTMRHVAEEAGVTQAAVSLALANKPGVSAETRKRIIEIARRLGYRRNPYITTLMRLRRSAHPVLDRPVLALVSAFERPDGWRTTPAPTVQQMRKGAIERAASRGFRTHDFWLYRDGMSNQRFSEVLRARGIQGMLLGPVAAGRPTPSLNWDYFSAVSLSAPFPHLTLTTVCNDHYFSSLQAVRECHRLGYRRPGLIMLSSHHARFQGRWEAGIYMAQREIHNGEPIGTLVVDDWDDILKLRAWYRRERPDVIVTPGAELLLPVLRRAGWRIPQDVGMASLGCSEPDHSCSGIYQNGYLMGATAMDLLISLVEHNEQGLPPQSRTMMVEGVWNPGATLRRQSP